MVLQIITVVVLVLTALVLMANIVILAVVGKMMAAMKPVTDIMETPMKDTLQEVLDIFAN